MIREEEAAEGDAITCPLHMVQWSDATEGSVPYNPWAEWGADQQYFIRGPYDPDCVWSLRMTLPKSRRDRRFAPPFLMTVLMEQ